MQYAYVPDSVIHPEYGSAVGSVLRVAAKDLGLKRLGVRFVVEGDKAPLSWDRLTVPDDDDQRKWGDRHTPAWASPERPGLIYLHPFYTGTVVQILLHEARHVWQYERDPSQADPDAFAAAYDANERDAVTYAADAMNRLGLREIPDDMPRVRRHPDGME